MHADIKSHRSGKEGNSFVLHFEFALEEPKTRKAKARLLSLVGHLSMAKELDDG
jgi:hypothetical protein